MLAYLYYPFETVVNMFYSTPELKEQEEKSIKQVETKTPLNLFHMSKEELDRQISLLKKSNYERPDYDLINKKSNFSFIEDIKTMDRKFLFESKNNSIKINDLNISVEEKRQKISEMLKAQKQRKAYVDKMNKIKENPILRKKYKEELIEFEIEQKNEIKKYIHNKN